jgi:hypothetical protein
VKAPFCIAAARVGSIAGRYHAVMSEPRPTIRRASSEDLPVLGRLGASLLGAHFRRTMIEMTREL